MPAPVNPPSAWFNFSLQFFSYYLSRCQHKMSFLCPLGRAMSSAWAALAVHWEGSEIEDLASLSYVTYDAVYSKISASSIFISPKDYRNCFSATTNKSSPISDLNWQRGRKKTAAQNPSPHFQELARTFYVIGIRYLSSGLSALQLLHLSQLVADVCAQHLHAKREKCQKRVYRREHHISELEPPPPRIVRDANEKSAEACSHISSCIIMPIAIASLPLCRFLNERARRTTHTRDGRVQTSEEMKLSDKDTAQMHCGINRFSTVSSRTTASIFFFPSYLADDKPSSPSVRRRETM